MSRLVPGAEPAEALYTDDGVVIIGNGGRIKLSITIHGARLELLKGGRLS